MKSILEFLTKQKIQPVNRTPIKYTPKSKAELIQIIHEELSINGKKIKTGVLDYEIQCNLNCIDTKYITDMSNIFNYSASRRRGAFNGDISEWDVSNVTDMTNMFLCSAFNGDISQWKPLSLLTATCMFRESNFTGENGDIGLWQLPELETAGLMFYKSDINLDLNGWNPVKLTKDGMYDMFDRTPLQNNPPVWYKK